ncbi:acetyltransferase [Lutispora saccharofermentans]|uniref:Acetyltransferase n=1 Tax=Lutispora saccharofermentans TaxID=3024236 RepID=A0ABT1ND31_9FIRM|nr:acetyltransferase [Lutispora saccharofermentans]MCQ1529169.1 acetyltransferase [Lutispora saccharofermentans]
MKDIIIIGAGGVGRETICLIDDINSKNHEWNIIGFVDDNMSIHGKTIHGHTVLGGINILNEYKAEVYAICTISDGLIKKKILDKIQNSDVVYPNLIHPSAVISKYVEFGKGVIIQANCVITSNIKIGNHVQLNPQCGIGHDVTIKDYASLYWNVNLSGFVTIGEGAVLGTKTTVIQNKRIGEWSVIGANATVINDIPANCVAVGSPAKPIKNRLEYI